MFMAGSVGGGIECVEGEGVRRLGHMHTGGAECTRASRSIRTNGRCEGTCPTRSAF